MENDETPNGRNVCSNAGLDATDVHTLVGHAIGMRHEGKEDFPKWLFGLAERLAMAIGDDELAASTRRIASNEAEALLKRELKKAHGA